ncbi:hypothetical protein [Streptomyces sp. KN37]|uniref:hypothetical protein n=1 Tax=Streptomyces sp. KN37 TaxID=3090667 RepID=UPI002A7647A9|nr:hypothetical protein [Streptomyces sp. KN37]WPO69949.1 hypothetical protein R9806_04535 [Streptomyces sp. KN37]
MSEPWTIERICGSLGDPKLTQRFLSEINKAPAHRILTVFAKWARIAKNLEAAFDEDVVAAARRGEAPCDDLVDGTERLEQAAAQRNRSHGAA